MTLEQFLRLVVTSPSGYFNLSTRAPDLSWKEHWFNWPNDIPDILKKVDAFKGTHDVYFSAHLFKEPSALKSLVLPTRTIQADLDAANLNELIIRPTTVVDTSEGRHQAYWIVDSDVEPEALETLSRRLSYSIPRCDITGWPLGHRVRVPTTRNFKYDDVQEVEVNLQWTVPSRVIETGSFEVLAFTGVEKFVDKISLDWIDLPHVEYEIGPVELLTKLPGGRALIHLTKTIETDRSKALWKLMCECFRLGMSKEDVYWIAHNNPNNKFKDRRQGVRDLRKDVLKAFKHIELEQASIRSAIRALSESAATVLTRRQKVTELILNDMTENGAFYHTTTGEGWYLQNGGRIIRVSALSESLGVFLCAQYGLNPVDVMHRHVKFELLTHINTLPAVAQRSQITHYDKNSELVYIHTGFKEIYRVGANDVTMIDNGYNNLIFQPPTSLEPFLINTADPIEDWAERLFTLENLSNITTEDARVLLKTWLLFFILRSEAHSRPVLAFFGAQGSGKTTTMRKIYALLYGSKKRLGVIGREEDFIAQASSDPFYVLDGVDTYISWFAERLSHSAGETEISRRTLYTDTDTTVVRMSAMFGVTAHQPKFLREDVVDRLLMFTTTRFDAQRPFRPDSLIIPPVLAMRPRLWGGIVKDLQKILRTPKPRADEVPIFRIQDYAYIGLWCARALGYESAFDAAIARLRMAQRSAIMNEEPLLMDALAAVAKKNKDTYVSTSALLSEMLSKSTDPQQLQRKYRSSTSLAVKLHTMMEALQTVFDISVRQEMTGKVWRIRERAKT